MSIRSMIRKFSDDYVCNAAVRFGCALQLPSPQDTILLTNYSWPGNVRELAAVIDL